MLKTIKHSRDLVHYINRSHTYPSNNSRSLALYIADFYNPKKGYAFPSQEKMAETFGTYPKTIRRWLKEIESTGYWEIKKGGKNNASQYFISETELVNIDLFLDAEAEHERINDEIPKIMPTSRRNDNMPAKTVADTGYVSSPLPEEFPEDIDGLKKSMLPYGFVQHAKPASFQELTLDKQEFLNLLISYLVQFDVIDRVKTDSVIKQMADTWLRDPGTDRDAFYNRYMHFLNKTHFAAPS